MRRPPPLLGPVPAEVRGLAPGSPPSSAPASTDSFDPTSGHEVNLSSALVPTPTKACSQSSTNGSGSYTTTVSTSTPGGSTAGRAAAVAEACSNHAFPFGRQGSVILEEEGFKSRRRGIDFLNEDALDGHGSPEGAFGDRGESAAAALARKIVSEVREELNLELLIQTETLVEAMKKERELCVVALQKAIQARVSGGSSGPLGFVRKEASIQSTQAVGRVDAIVPGDIMQEEAIANANAAMQLPRPRSKEANANANAAMQSPRHRSKEANANAIAAMQSPRHRSKDGAVPAFFPTNAVAAAAAADDERRSDSEEHEDPVPAKGRAAALEAPLPRRTLEAAAFGAVKSMTTGQLVGGHTVKPGLQRGGQWSGTRVLDWSPAPPAKAARAMSTVDRMIEDLRVAARTDVRALVATKGWATSGQGDMERAGANKAGRAITVENLRMQKRAETRRILQSFSGTLVALNVVFVGVYTDQALRAEFGGLSEPGWLHWCLMGLLGAFLIEIYARIQLERLDFIFGEDRWWNAFDLVMLVAGVADFATGLLGSPFRLLLTHMRVIHVFRLRLLGDLWIFRLLHPLRLMLASCLCALPSLLWACLLIFSVVYLFACFLSMCILSNLRIRKLEAGDAAPPEGVEDLYGTLFHSFLSLFMSVTSGDTLGALLLPLRRMSPLYDCFFVFYISFVVIGVMNLVTAIFVDRHAVVAMKDRELALRKDMLRDADAANELRSIFHEADLDCSNTISRTELERCLGEEETINNLRVLQLDGTQTRGLFELIDIDRVGNVDIEEFVCGMMRLRGNVKHVDYSTVMYESKIIMLRLSAFMRFTEECFVGVQTALTQVHKETRKTTAGDSHHHHHHRSSTGHHHHHHHQDERRKLAKMHP